jgi:hypothetical protein
MRKVVVPREVTIVDALTEKSGRSFTSVKFKMLFIRNKTLIHQVEVRNVNFLDLMRHLEAGESVEIIPELDNNATDEHGRDRAPWYIVHM